MAETKDQAEARKATAEASKAEIEAREFGSPTAQALREAERRQQLLTAEKESIAAQVGRYSDLVPDLSGVASGTTVSGTSAVYESAVLARALDTACRAIVVDVLADRDLPVVLVTTEADMIASEDAFRRMDAALEELDAAAQKLLMPVVDGKEGLLPVLGLISAALPTVMSLLTKTHTVSSVVSAPHVAVASTLICKHLLARKGTTVLHDTFRLIGDGPLDAKMQALRQTRADLEVVAAIPTDESEPDPRVAAAGALITRIDAFVSAVTATTGSARSVMAMARSRQALHGATPVHVLLLHDPSATVSQLVEEKTGDDTFRVVGTASVSWILIRSDREGLVAAGVGTGSAAEGDKIENIGKR